LRRKEVLEAFQHRPCNLGLPPCLQRSVETSQTSHEDVSEDSCVGASPRLPPRKPWGAGTPAWQEPRQKRQKTRSVWRGHPVTLAAQPSSSLRLQSSESNDPPRLADDPPGLADDSPGLADDSPGLADDSPGLADDSPRLADDSPGLADDSPGLADDSPRLADDSPRLADDSPRLADDSPGLADDSPGLANDSPGLANDAPGLANVSPGLANEAPGLANEAPGLANEAPRLADDSPGLADDPPRLANDAPGLASEASGLADHSPRLVDQPLGLTDAPPAPAGLLGERALLAGERLVVLDRLEGRALGIDVRLAPARQRIGDGDRRLHVRQASREEPEVASGRARPPHPPWRGGPNGPNWWHLPSPVAHQPGGRQTVAPGVSPGYQPPTTQEPRQGRQTLGRSALLTSELLVVWIR
jgi:hypothetical protein